METMTVSNLNSNLGCGHVCIIQVIQESNANMLMNANDKSGGYKYSDVVSKAAKQPRSSINFESPRVRSPRVRRKQRKHRRKQHKEQHL